MKPCRKIGMVFGCMEVLDARTIRINGKQNSQYRIRCVNCGTERWNNTATVLRGTAKCYECNPLEKPMIPNGTLNGIPKGLIISYRCMVSRCTRPKDCHWDYYGGRGIRVCHEWLHDFTQFVKWAHENGWAEGKTIDRIDSNGNYEPSNCRWADAKMQTNNLRTNIRLEYMGENMTLAQFCEKTGAGYDRARYLIFRKHMNAEDALKAIQNEPQKERERV